MVQQADEDYQDMDSFSTIKGDEMDERRPSMVEELQAWNSWLKPLVQKQNCLFKSHDFEWEAPQVPIRCLVPASL